MGRNFVVLDAADYAGSNKFLQYFGEHDVGDAREMLFQLAEAQCVMDKKLVDYFELPFSAEQVNCNCRRARRFKGSIHHYGMVKFFGSFVWKHFIKSFHGIVI